MQCSIDVDYTNYILTYQDTRLVPKCYAFHLVVALTGLPSIEYSVIVVLTGLPKGYSVIVALLFIGRWVLSWDRHWLIPRDLQ